MSVFLPLLFLLQCFFIIWSFDHLFLVLRFFFPFVFLIITGIIWLSNFFYLANIWDFCSFISLFCSCHTFFWFRSYNDHGGTKYGVIIRDCTLTSVGLQIWSFRKQADWCVTYYVRFFHNKDTSASTYKIASTRYRSPQGDMVTTRRHGRQHTMLAS